MVKTIMCYSDDFSHNPPCGWKDRDGWVELDKDLKVIVCKITDEAYEDMCIGICFPNTLTEDDIIDWFYWDDPDFTAKVIK